MPRLRAFFRLRGRSPFSFHTNLTGGDMTEHIREKLNGWKRAIIPSILAGVGGFLLNGYITAKVITEKVEFNTGRITNLEYSVAGVKEENAAQNAKIERFERVTDRLELILDRYEKKIIELDQRNTNKQKE
jgi:hypothetical protein